MIRKFLISVLSLATTGFMILTISRMTMDYNENGVYFDGEVRYDTDAIVAYGTITGTLLLLTIGLLLIGRNRHVRKQNRRI